MIVYGNRSKKQTGITFPQMECWSPMTEMATFAADLNGDRIMCRVESQALASLRPQCSEDPMQALAASRSELQSIARRLIERERFEEDGSILIRATDV